MKTVLLLFCLLGSVVGFGQQVDTLIKKLDSLERKTDSAGGQINNTAPQAYTEATTMNFKTFFVLEGSNLKQAFTKPFHMTGRNWRDFGIFAVATGALMLVDEPVQRFALDLRNSNRSLRSVSGFVTDFGGLYEAYTLGALAGYGYLFKNKKVQTTTLLAVQAYITGAVVENVIKYASGRQRPYAVDPRQVEAEPTFRGPFARLRDADGKKLNSAFPSGHTTVAFAAATVYALEYNNKPWVKVLSYGAASLIGLSRITENKHWVTDVVVGAALGYLSGKLVVNNYHRYAKIKAPNRRKPAMSLSMGFGNGQIMPGLICRF